MAAITISTLTGWPCASATSRMDAPMAPGPAIKGVASGKADTSCLAAASARSSAVVVVPPDERANTMSSAINRSSTPPAVRKRRQGDAEGRQHPLAKQREEQEDQAADQAALERHGASLARRVVWRQRGNSAAVSSGPMSRRTW